MPAAIVSDGELFVSQTVKIILLIILLGSIAFNVVRFIRREDRKKRITNVIAIGLIATLFVFVLMIFIKERDLYVNAQYTIGTTTGDCNAFMLGKGLGFEYTVDGITYHNCNTYHPVPRDSIVVEGGTYRVRYSAKYPAKGRMDFRIIATKAKQ